MRNKHHRTSHKLGKRAFALCLALAVICSCLVPVFATGGIATMDGGFVMDEGFGVGGDDAGFAVDTQEVPASADDAATMEMPASSGDAATMDTPVVDTGDAASTSGPTITTKETEYGTVTEYDWGDSQTTWTGEDAIATPNDHMKEDDAAFGVLPIEYHFWLKQLDSFDFQMLAHEAEMAEMSETEYLALFGSSEQYPIWHMDTIASTDTISNYKFANPTAKDDPAGENHEFAYWYTVDENGVETEFDPYKTYGSETDTTVNVYAKWKDASGDVAQDTTKTEDTAKTESKTVEVSSKAVISETEDEVTITVKGLPENVKSLSVTTMGEGSMNTFYELYAAQNGTMAPLFGFKIAPKDADGNTVQPKGPVTVTISGLPDDIMISELAPFKVLHQVSDTDIETINASYNNNGTLTFATDSFSPFVIASKNGYGIDTMEIMTKDGGSAEISLYGSVVLSSDEKGNITSSSWTLEDDNNNLLSLSNKQNTSVTVYAQKANAQDTAVTVKHSYTSNSKKYEERYTVVVKGTSGSDSSKGHWVYLYVKTDASTAQKLGLVTNPSGWFTVGKVYVSTMDEPTSALANSSRHFYNQSVTGINYLKTGTETYTYDGSNWGKVVDSNGKVIGNVERYTLNTKVLLDNVQWSYGWENGSTSGNYGLIVGSGADNYISANKWSPQWHLDGYLVTEGRVIIRHFAVDDNGNTHELTDLQQIVPGAVGDVVSSFGKQYESVEYNNESYSFDHFGNPEQCEIKAQDQYLDIYYSRSTANLTVSKTVTGLLGEKTKAFDFELYVRSTVNTNKVTWTKSLNGASVATETGNLGESSSYTTNVDGVQYKVYSFALKDSESITFENLPAGTYYIDEADDSASDYITSYAIGSAESVNGRRATVVLGNTGASVAFTNDRDLDPDTGVLLDTLPYIVILAVVVGGGILLMLRKRRKNDD